MAITIRARREGFRRCGIAHSVAPVTYADGTFGASQIDALRCEPMLIVEEPLAGESGKRPATPATSPTPASDSAASTPASSPAKASENPAPAPGKAPATPSEKSDAKAGKAPAAARKTTKAK